MWHMILNESGLPPLSGGQFDMTAVSQLLSGGQFDQVSVVPSSSVVSIVTPETKYKMCLT